MITRRNGWKFAAAGLALMTAIPASAQTTIGRVLMTAGETSALREGKVLPLTFGSPIEARDTLQTGPRSNLQIRLTDESILSMREQSHLRIENYQFSGKGDDASDSAVFSLVKGAFRTVTGLIGRRDHSRYAVQTPSGTIGIRGTMYAASVCDRDCRNADGTLAPDGLYGMVIGQSQGTNKVALTNKSGETMRKSLNKAMELGLGLKDEAEKPADVVALTATEMQEYAGSYSHAPQTWDVSVKDGKLIMKFDGKEHQLTKTGERKFTFGANNENEIVFAPGKNGKIDFIFTGLYAAKRVP